MMRRYLAALATLALISGAAADSYINGNTTVTLTAIWAAITGDCTASGGALTCTKTGGVAFAPSATTNALNASNISSGTLGVPQGGTGGGVASGTLLDNITAFSSTGYLKRTGTGAYSLNSTIALADGGTGAGTQSGAAANIFPTPTRAGDIAYWNGSSWATVAGNNSGTQFLQETAAGVPSWATAVGSGTVTNIATGTGLSGGPITSTGTISLSAARQTLPTTQSFTSGSGTYTTPANVLWIEVNLVGGGAGGAGIGSGAAAGGNGGNTCWNTSGAACTTPVYQAGGGSGSASAIAAGGTVSGSGTCTTALTGGSGGVKGGNSSLGGAGNSVLNNGAQVGSAAASNTGSGGGGGSSGTAMNPGGGAGATCYVIIGSPAATYTYAIGTGGSAGTGATANGGAGAAGSIRVIEHYGS